MRQVISTEGTELAVDLAGGTIFAGCGAEATGMMIYALLYNMKLGRWHPILFRMAPMPGNADQDAAQWRYKSAGHHTEGFETKEAAERRIETDCRERGWTASGREYPWDGECVPAMVEFFPRSGLVYGYPLLGVSTPIPGE